MKFIIFILFSLIALNHAISVNRVEKKKKTQKTMADNGDGNWKDGFNSPGILVVQGNEAFNDDEQYRLGKGKFFPVNLENPKSDFDKLGLVFDMSKKLPTGKLLEVLLPTGKPNEFYLPFRWGTSDFKYSNPHDYKTIEVWITNDKKVSYHLQWLLPYKFFGWYISDEEGNKICGLLNTQKAQHIAIVKTNKSNAVSAANSLLSSKPLLDSASKDAAKLKEERGKQQKASDDLKIQLTSSQKEFADIQTKINDLDSQIQALKSKQTEKSNQINSISGQISTIAQNLDKNKGDDLAKLVKDYQDQTTKAQADLKTAADNLGTEAPNRKDDLSKAVKDFVTDLNKANLDKTLATISP